MGSVVFWRKAASVVLPGALAALFGGCASMVTAMDNMAGIGVFKDEVASFDGARYISVSPAWLVENSTDIGNAPFKLGARWVSSSPDVVVLKVLYESDTSGSISGIFTNFSGIDINIGGEISSYKALRTEHSDSGWNSASRTIDTSSKGDILIPLDVFFGMMNAEDCRIRIHSKDGYADAIFSLDRSRSGTLTARHYFRRLADAILEFQANGANQAETMEAPIPASG